jgi:hypothetical protein
MTSTIFKHRLRPLSWDGDATPQVMWAANMDIARIEVEGFETGPSQMVRASRLDSVPRRL